MTTLSDNRLLERLESGDRASFETLFHRHYDRVYGLLFRLVGNRVEAEDLTQEAFITLYREAWRADRDHNVGAWLYRVATNLGYNALRARRRRRERDRHLLPDATDAPLDPRQSVQAKEAITAVRATLAQMPERQVQLLLLRQMGLSYAELAEACGVAPGSVGQMLARSAAAFRRLYQGDSDVS